MLYFHSALLKTTLRDIGHLYKELHYYYYYDDDDDDDEDDDDDDVSDNILAIKSQISPDSPRTHCTLCGAISITAAINNSSPHCNPI